mmetsp:Transcript_6309/g.13982  ORF Transcript_6309/g.13982 Transcript_6309/m.13982 type:complete len:232 (-) Transcript_6309:1102-1797(-)
MPRASLCKSNTPHRCARHRRDANEPRTRAWIAVAALLRRVAVARLHQRWSGRRMRVAACSIRASRMTRSMRVKTSIPSIPRRIIRFRRLCSHLVTRVTISSDEISPCPVSRSRKASWPARKNTRVIPSLYLVRSISKASRIASTKSASDKRETAGGMTGRYRVASSLYGQRVGYPACMSSSASIIPEQRNCISTYEPSKALALEARLVLMQRMKCGAQACKSSCSLAICDM